MDFDYRQALRRLDRHRDTFVNTLEVTKVLPALAQTEAFTKRDEAEVKWYTLHFVPTFSFWKKKNYAATFSFMTKGNQ